MALHLKPLAKKSVQVALAKTKTVTPIPGGKKIHLAAGPVQLTAPLAAKSVPLTKKSKPANTTPLTERDFSTLEDGELADVYGHYMDQRDALLANPVFAKFAAVEKELHSRIDEIHTALVLKGEKWHVECGQQSKAAPTLKNKKLAAEMLGDKVFWEVCGLSITDLRKYLTPDQLAKVLNDADGYIKRRTIEAKYLG